MAATAVVGSFTGLAYAADLPHLTNSCPTAKALGYVEDASSAKSSLYKTGSSCANCQFYSGGADGKWWADYVKIRCHASEARGA